MKVTPENLYKKIFDYCNKKGLIKKLKKSFILGEEKDYNKLDISSNGLSLLDAVHCVYDKRRTMFFLDEVKKYVKSDSVVLEAGVGTGILSFFASSRSPWVYGFEINPTIFTFANKVKNYLSDKKVFFSKPPVFQLKDATKVQVPESVDVLISENIYTGMFFEQQVQIMNNTLSCLKKDGVVIPHKLEFFIILSQIDLPKKVRNKDIFIPSSERKIHFETKPLSKPVSYELLDFKKQSALGTKKKLSIPITCTGKINSLIIYNEVIMPSGVVIGRTDTTFLNNDIIIAIRPSLKVKRGDIINLHLAYSYGSNPKDAKFSLKKK